MARFGRRIRLLMTCADFEILLADYVDGTLHGEQKSAVESSSGRRARRARSWRATPPARWRSWSAPPIVEAPPELVTRILFEITDGPSHAVVKPSWVAADFREMAGADFAAALRHGHGDDGSVVRHAGAVFGNRGAAVDAVRSGSGEGLDGRRGSRAADLGAHREVLRESAGGV